jgi:EAL domain-containing protein (putative c-di-GMP-specific phosphodiesterase class I)/CHASE2 domain-containing sensor protein
MVWLRSPRSGNVSAEKGAYSRRRIFLWAALISLVCGLLELGQPLEDYLRIARNWSHQEKASGDIIVIAIDDKSLQETGSWPWPRSQHGRLATKLDQLGARRIFFDIDFSSRTAPAEDKSFARSLAALKGKVTLAALTTEDPSTGKITELGPLPEFRRAVDLANINLRYGRASIVWELPYAWQLRDGEQISFSAALAGKSVEGAGSYPIDHSIDPRSVPVISAVDILNDKVAAGLIAGKDVVIGANSHQLGDLYYSPGHGMTAGVFFHVVGAETLKKAPPLQLSWLPAYLMALALALAAYASRSRAAIVVPILGAGIAAALAAPLALERKLIFVDIVPALLLLSILAGRLAWQEYRQTARLRGVINAVSGLPNLNALRQDNVADRRTLVAARVQNFPSITSSLPEDQERSLVEQIAGRLAFGGARERVYQGDEGIFVWFADDGTVGSLGDQLEALHALFRSPVVVGGNQIDLTITFGVEVSADRSVSNRLGSALVAADEAAAEGIRWKRYDPAKLKDAAWRLSLLSQLDAAIDSGDLWVAYQPKLDLRTGRIVGAEALARWTHPEKGPISPLEFISAAEQSDRIEKLTRHVLDRAIAAAAIVNARGIDFDISVNLSARLIDDTTLPPMITSILERHGLDPSRLTLEVTETAAITSTERSLESLLSLRYLGVQISIDDYGTGHSTLDYLKRIPATEIKIDRSFVSAITRSPSDRLLVNSTIQLAHSLGQTVVAEGVEDQETLNSLTAMSCDVG